MNRLGDQSITRLRYPAPTYAEGYALRGAATSTTISATVAPAARRSRVLDPSGDEVTPAIELLSYAELRAANEAAGTPPDRLTVGGETYEIVTSTRMPPFCGEPQHWVASAVLVGALPAEPDGADHPAHPEHPEHPAHP